MKHFFKTEITDVWDFNESIVRKIHVDRYEICYLVNLKPNPNLGIIETYDFYFLFCFKPHRSGNEFLFF